MSSEELSVVLFDKKAIIKMFDVLDNETVAKVVKGEKDYNAIPIEDQGNEIVKGYFFKDQSDFIEKYGNGQPLCAAISGPCIKDKCQLYAASIQKHPICREYKTYFKGIGNGQLLSYVEQEFMKAIRRVQQKNKR